MNALPKRVGRMLAEHKGRYAGIVILILLGSLYFTVASGVAGTLDRMVVGFAEHNHQEDVTFTTDQPLTDVASLASASGVTIEARQQRTVSLPGSELRLLSPGPAINRPEVLSGRGLQNPHEVLLDPRFLQTQGLQVGDRLAVGDLSLTIVGTFAVPNYVYLLKNFYDVLPSAGFGIGTVSASDLAAFPATTADATNSYSARFADRDDLTGQLRGLREQLSESGSTVSEWIAAKDNARITMPQGNIASLQSMSFPVSIAFFLLSCLIIGVMIMRTVKADSVIIGALYALGYRRGELTRHYLAIPLLLSAAGGLVGTLLGLAAVGPVVSSMQSGYNLPSTGLLFTPVNLAFGVLAPAILIGAASLLAVRRILRKRPADLMKGDEQAAKVNVIERALRLDRFQFATKFRIREQVRSIPRLLFLVLGVAAASMVMLFGLTFSNSMDTLTEQGSVTRYTYPLEYNFTKTQNLQQRPLPAGAEPYHALRVHPEGRESVKFYLTGIQPDSVGMKLKDLEGAELARDQVNLTSPLADRLGVGVGDEVRMINTVDGAAYSLRVDGIIQAYGEQFMTIPLDQLNQLAGFPAGSYRTVLANHELSVDQSELAGVLDTRDPDAFDDLSAPTELIVGSVTGLAVLIAVVILFLVVSLIIEENRGTISLLKIMGYRRKEIAKLILNSTTPAVLVGFLLGVPFMLGFGTVLFGFVAETVNLVIPMAMSPFHVVISFVVIFAVFQLTKWLSGRKLAKVPMADALKAGSE